MVNGAHSVDAGVFSTWLESMESVIKDGRGSNVPCGDCTACCTSSQFIHIQPDEAETLDHVPKALLFPAPKMPIGHVLMGYDERGHCPMLIDNECSIYDYRPRTCRSYDCRVFAASGHNLNSPDHALIADRVRQWRFQLPTEDDRLDLAAVRAAARYLDEHADDCGVTSGPNATTQHSLLALQLARFFREIPDGSDETVHESPTSEAVRVEIRRLRRG